MASFYYNYLIFSVHFFFRLYIYFFSFQHPFISTGVVTIIYLFIILFIYLLFYLFIYLLFIFCLSVY